MSGFQRRSLPPHARVLLAVACLLGCAGTAFAAAPSPPTLPLRPASGYTDAVRTHALAFGAILDVQNGEPHSQLVRPDERKEAETTTKESMASWWDIHSREELLGTLEGLRSGENGQRYAYWNIRRRLLEGKMENYPRIIYEASSDDDGRARAITVATHLGPLHGAALPITAWDFGRYINLCRWGYVCGWLTEQEAWDRIIPAARLLQASYASWDDYAADYLVGRNFWNPQAGAENETVRYIVTLLKLPPRGLWATIQWNEPLGAGEILRDPLAATLLENYQEPDPNGVSLDHVPNRNPLIMMLRASADSK